MSTNVVISLLKLFLDIFCYGVNSTIF